MGKRSDHRKDLGPSANQAFFATVCVTIAITWLFGRGAVERVDWTDWLLWLGPPVALILTAPIIVFGWTGTLEVLGAIAEGIGDAFDGIDTSDSGDGIDSSDAGDAGGDD
jgi:hypothetical protein